MKKTSEKKINWKNVAIIGGVFVLGMATGVVGGRKVLDYIIENEDEVIKVTKCVTMGKPGVTLTMGCEKAGIMIPMDVSRGFVTGMLHIIDGTPVDADEIFD